MDRIYRRLMRIRGIGAKVAGVYLRDIIYHLKVWPFLTEYLYLPIDRHIRNILVNKLQVFHNSEVPRVGESYFTRKNQRFQKLLNELHRPRVEIDYFWAIGAMFCAYYLCNYCWIKDFCQKSLSIIDAISKELVNSNI